MSSRIKWNIEEQSHLKQLKDTEGIQSWRVIAEKMNQKFPGVERSGKQCRERYINYVRFCESEGRLSEWTREDDEKLTRLYFEHGAKWSCIVKFMGEKSENCLKNRFYGGLRRTTRKINRIQKQLRIRKTKPIRYENLMRILCYQASGNESLAARQQQGQSFDDFLLSLKTVILQETWNILNEEDNDSQIFDLIESIHEFNARIRGISFKKTPKRDAIVEKMAQPTCPSQISTENSVQAMIEACEENKPDSWESLWNSWPTGWKLESSNEVQDDLISLEMRDICPKAEWRSDSDVFDLEVSQIMREDHVPLMFNFFQ